MVNMFLFYIQTSEKKEEFIKKHKKGAKGGRKGYKLGFLKIRLQIIGKKIVILPYQKVLINTKIFCNYN